MSLIIQEVSPQSIATYESIPIAFKVRSFLRVETLNDGLAGLALHEQLVETPYIKDYDSQPGGKPSAWLREFDTRNWGFLLARQGQQNLGAAAIAFNTNGVNMLEGRPDLAVLWDIRVEPQVRGHGIGRQLLAGAANWARQRGCRQLKIETQNINVPACRFYASQGCELGIIHRYAYAAQPEIAHEVMLIWYLSLT